MDWAGRYIDLPYADKGRTVDGLDCWGLARLIYRDQLGIELPSYLEGYTSAEEAAEVAALIEENKPLWHEVARPQPFDLVALRLKGHPMHCGVCVGQGRFIHVMLGTNVTVERLDSPLWAKRITGYFRHDSRI